MDTERQQLDVLTLDLPVPPAGQTHVNHFQLISDSSLSCGVPAGVGSLPLWEVGPSRLYPTLTCYTLPSQVLVLPSVGLVTWIHLCIKSASQPINQ